MLLPPPPPPAPVSGGEAIVVMPSAVGVTEYTLSSAAQLSSGGAISVAMRHSHSIAAQYVDPPAVHMP